MIVAKIDVTKIDKTRLFKGEKGTYLDICLIETPNSAYGDDYMVTQSVSKEDREKGVKGAILGNAKIMGQRQQQRPAGQDPCGSRQPTRPAPAPQQNLDEDVPF